MGEELKPCPFCEGEAKVDQFCPDAMNQWRLICEECEAWGPERETHEQAIAAWNTRALPDGGWLDIAGAPKDGTPILVTNSKRGGSWIAYYCVRYASGMNRENPWSSLMLNTRWHSHQYASTIPTHWMPLPAPPAEATCKENLQGKGECIAGDLKEGRNDGLS